jgi:hypothetical protein
MTVIGNQIPEPRKPRPHRAWADWLVISLTLAGTWFGLCQLVQYIMTG